MAQKRPFLEDGSQYGVSRTAFRRMRKAEKRELMIAWFHANYEDPAERTPYESAEGGYQWIWGGPYDAREELSTQFGDIASEALIEEVAKHVERHGLFEWAPIDRGDDLEEPEGPDTPPDIYDISDEPSAAYGTPLDREMRGRVAATLDDLQQALDHAPPIGIGHNRPPEAIEPTEIEELRPAVQHLRAEFGKATPSIARVKQWTRPVRTALIACTKWIGAKLDKAADSAASTAGPAILIWLASQLSPHLHSVFNALIEWLQIVAKSVL